MSQFGESIQTLSCVTSLFLLEYCTPVWSPYLKKDVRKIESIQRRATKLILIVKDLSYENRLNTIGLPTLEYRGDRYDMMNTLSFINTVTDMFIEF
jgi:hypothetical protein